MVQAVYDLSTIACAAAWLRAAQSTRDVISFSS